MVSNEAKKSVGSGGVYTGEALRHVAMPLGGLGAGQIALAGDGGLRQWQMVNQVNHLGFVPDSFFTLRVASIEPPVNMSRVLLSRERHELPESGTPLVNDDHIPQDQRALTERFRGVDRTTFTNAYPFARLAYEDSELPVDVELEAYTPFLPLEAEESGLPAIMFTFRISNRWEHELTGWIGATMQNAVGWDGITPISGNRCPLYGGNTNQVRRRDDYTALVMENPALPEDHPGSGQMVLSAPSNGIRVYERWTEPEQFMRFMEGLTPVLNARSPDEIDERNLKSKPVAPSGPSPAGETWDGGLLVPFNLAPGQTADIGFVLSWYFPNRYVNFDQYGPRRDYGRSRFWVGNAYATRFSEAAEVNEYLLGNRERLRDVSERWSDNLRSSTLPAWMSEALAAQGSFLRTPTCFWAEDGKFYGFEGGLGASTGMSLGTYGGSCPLNCTHVWNYEQTLSRLFPGLERTMRQTELETVQAPEGYIPHRTVLPLYLPQFRDEHIGGPANPALDGMLGTVLKVYREGRQGAGREWLAKQWPKVRKLLVYIMERWDPDGDGVLDGEQPNTYDIAFYGPNMYIGGLWLAALRAAEEIAKLQGDTSFARELRGLFERGSSRYDELLWNGEYYIQILNPDVPTENQFGDGCLADQLFGQWWAHLLELGHLLPEEHVKTTLRSIFDYNFYREFHNFQHGFRVFADRDESGLVMCTWPHGGRPEIPVRYCDEVWTGIEYQFGSHCIMEGLQEEGYRILSALRARYSGSRRNPYNEIECGDHYVRAMAGWSMLEAISGFRYDALEERLTFVPFYGAANSSYTLRYPFIAGTGWGALEQTTSTDSFSSTVRCEYGEVYVSRIRVTAAGQGEPSVLINDTRLSASSKYAQEMLEVELREPLTLSQGDLLEIVQYLP